MYVCLYVYMYMYMYICTYTHTSQAVSAKLKNTNGEALCPRRLESLSCESLSPVLSPNRHGDGILPTCEPNLFRFDSECQNSKLSARALGLV